MNVNTNTSNNETIKTINADTSAPLAKDSAERLSFEHITPEQISEDVNYLLANEPSIAIDYEKEEYTYDDHIRYMACEIQGWMARQKSATDFVNHTRKIAKRNKR